MILYVYPTMRAMLKELSQKEPSLENEFISLESFLNKSSYTPNKFMLSSSQKYIFLNKSIKDIDLSKLGISNDFLFFLKNHDIIFKFFNEMYNENISFENIKSSDIYEEFIEHIEILETVYKIYQDLLAKNNSYDSSTHREILANVPYIKSFEKIHIFIEGYLSKQELDLLTKLSLYVTVILEIQSSRYNKKVFDDLGLKVDLYQKYSYDYGNKKIINQKSIKSEQDLKLDIYPVPDNISEVYFVFYKIEEYIKNGISPQDIVVILPNEQFASKLKAFDENNNLNFAMGISFTNTISYKKIIAIYECIIDNNDENLKRLEVLGLDDDFANESLDDIFDLLEKVKNEKSQSIIDNLIFNLKIIKKELSIYKFSDILSYVISELQSKSIDDNSGGKIRVTGILESRYIQYNALIIANFNHKIAPKYSKKDIFLNSKLKKIAKMPTREDRHNLQKYFYYRLMQNAKHISISYLDNEKDSKSIFLDELGFFQANITYHQSCIYFKDNLNNQEIRYSYIKNKKLYEKEIGFSEDNKNISFSKLKTFIDCKRKFYFNYLSPYNFRKNTTKDIELMPSIATASSKIHSILSKLGKKNDFSSLDEEFIKAIKEDRKYSYYLLSSLINVDKMQKLEKQRIKDGYKIFATEDDFSVPYNGLILKGRVDRIDIKNNDLYIIDYKYHSSVKPRELKKDELQLMFYLKAISIKYPNHNILLAGIYDLKFSKISFLQDYDINVLNIELENYKKGFKADMCENTKICGYCDYNIICDRM